jgi:hypothetical protein
LKRNLAERDREIAHLQDQLAASEARDGSLFDLKKDSAKDIADTIVSTISPNKAETIARAILKTIKAKSAAHAG